MKQKTLDQAILEKLRRLESESLRGPWRKTSCVGGDGEWNLGAHGMWAATASEEADFLLELRNNAGWLLKLAEEALAARERAEVQNVGI